MCLVLGLLFLLLGLVCGMLIMPHVIGGGCLLPLLIACGGGRLASVCCCFLLFSFAFLLAFALVCPFPPPLWELGLLGCGLLASVRCCFLFVSFACFLCGGCPLPLLIACGGGRLLGLLFLLLVLMCGMLIMQHVSIVYTSVSIAWICVRDADYAACVYCLHFCMYCLDLCAGC